MCIMDDISGNMNEIWNTDDALNEKDKTLHFLTIEDAVNYQKSHLNKIFILDEENDPKEVIEYIKHSHCVCIF